MLRKSRLITAVTCILLGASFTGVVPAAANDKRAQHCVYAVVDQTKNGQFILGGPRCFTSFADALAATGAQVESRDVTPRDVTREQLRSGGIVGVHYEDHDLDGSSMTVFGSVCNSGWLNVPGNWNDRISSTANGCPRIAHREHADLTGAEYDTYEPWGNITGVMDNETTSIQYFAS